jgi:phosphonoacetate hydrolase
VLPLVGMPVPDVYSAELSGSFSRPGAPARPAARPDVLSTTITCSTNAPGPEANRFYAMLDRYLTRLDELGAVIALTADTA